jgi:hypothetical protein
MSREIDMLTEKAKLEKKFKSRLGESNALELVAKHESMSKEQLEERMLELAKTGQGIINTKNADKELNDLKDQVREQSKTHNDQLRANKELTRFVSLLISEKYGDKLMDLQTEDEE